MTLLFIDGFDHYAPSDITKKWTNADAVTLSAGSGRRGGVGAFWGGNASGATKSLAASVSTIIVGVAFKSAIPGGGNGFLLLRDSGFVHLRLLANSDGSISVLRDFTVLGTTAGGLLSAQTYHYVEIKATISDTVGSVVLRLDGAQVLSLSNVDTRNGNNASVNQVRLQSGASSGDITFDDLYICDTNGSVNNDFLGDVRVDALYPTSDGANAAWTPSTGTTHYALVDEATPNTTDYVESSTAGQKDTYGFADISHTPVSIFGAQVNIAALKDDAGARSIKAVTRSAGADYSGASQALSTSQLYYNEIRETDPATSAAWTKANLDAAEFGVECV